jgi:hypothetical protein
MPWRRMGSGCIDPHFLTSTLVGGEWSASRLGRFIPGDTHCIESWVDPELVWTSWRRENSWPYRDSNSDPSDVQPVAIPNHYLNKVSWRVRLTFSRQRYWRRVQCVDRDLWCGDFRFHAILKMKTSKYLMITQRSLSLSDNDVIQRCFMHIY